jgi:hypothetical protein
MPSTATSSPPRNSEQQNIKIKGIVIDEVSEPRMDGTLGSALYKIPFQLSRRPSLEWTNVFLHFWDHPPQFTTMHRPGIASVVGDKIILDGTTVEEVQQYHRDTLVLVVDRTNEEFRRLQLSRQQIEKQKQIDAQEHKKKIQDLSKKINFE